jgi:glycosyltransferase involved in cell wall biosynthesis
MPKTFNAECPRILQVGTNPNKNVPRLIYALEGIPCRLVLIGKLDSPIHAALEETGTVFENRVGIDQHALFQEYTAADLVAFVSINEGFGLPIIEAQAMGRPLVTSNIPPMSIIAGSGACLADPLSIKAIKKVILRLIEDEQCRRQVIIDGLKNVKEYTQSAVVEKYLTTYQTLPTGRFCVTPFIS